MKRLFKNTSPDIATHCQKTGILFRENHKAAKFTGATHAEATLMGLLKSFPLGPSFANHDVEIQVVELLKQLVEPVCLLFLPTCMYLMYKLFGRRRQATFENAIAVDKRCCSCCDRLGTLLGNVKWPGSHEVLYSWRPP